VATPAPALTLWGIAQGAGVNSNGEILAYSVSTSSTTATLVPNSAYSERRPTINFNPAGINVPEQLAFDTAGRLWVVNQASNLLVSFTISAPGTPPVLNLNSGLSIPYPSNYQPEPGPYSDGPYFLAYDPVANSLWTNSYESFPYGLQDSAIGPSGRTTSVTTSVSAPTAPGVNGIAFDKNGVLWGIEAFSTPGMLTAFSISGGTATEIAGSQLSTTGGTPVFDAANHLWFADFPETSQANTPPKVYEYTNPGTSGNAPALLASFSVAAAPPGTTRLIYPIGFDPQGNLWLQAVDDDNTSGLPDDSQLLAYSVGTTPALLTTIPLPALGFSYPGGFVIQP
jgi:hypothetical protein